MSSAPVFILPLDTLDATLERVGGKSLNLGTMTRAGLPVGAGFTLTTAAYRAFVLDNHLTEPIAQALADHVGRPARSSSTSPR